MKYLIQSAGRRLLFLSALTSHLIGADAALDDYKIYTESSIEGRGSNYLFIAPSELPIERSIEEEMAVLMSEETDPFFPKRYKESSGFAFFRSITPKEYYYEDADSVEGFLKRETDRQNVLFYAIKQDFEGATGDLVCQGELFSPLQGPGIFFLRKKFHTVEDTTPVEEFPWETTTPYPFYHSTTYLQHSCYLIYYTFSEERELAKEKFETLSSYIHTAVDGVVE
ncbi:MAG: hypothetical protein K0S07_1291 [Chlamydiales bacterium]|nr:hypothetical protein [Chlamydiales bacterium]